MSAAAAPVVSAVLRDHSSAIGSYFGSVRVPASFLAGTSFGGVFALKPRNFAVGKDKNDGRNIEAIFATVYTISMVLSFVLSMNTIVLATAAGVKALNADFDPMATTGYELLNREFHFEFTLSRWSFLVSLFLFLVAVSNRMLLEFKLFSTEGPLKVRRQQIGVAVICLLSSLCLHLLSFVNSTLFCWNNFLDMTLDVLKTLLTRGSWTRPLEPFAVILLASGIAFMAHAFTL